MAQVFLIVHHKDGIPYLFKEFAKSDKKGQSPVAVWTRHEKDSKVWEYLSTCWEFYNEHIKDRRYTYILSLMDR